MGNVQGGDRILQHMEARHHVLSIAHAPSTYFPAGTGLSSQTPKAEL